MPSCAEGGVLGVLGVLCAAIGAVQAAEAVKLIVGIGDPLVGRLLVHDGMAQRWDVLSVVKNPLCAVCGQRPSVTKLVDYQDFCAPRPPAAVAVASGSVRAVAVPAMSAMELSDLLSEQGGTVAVMVGDVRGSQERASAAIPGARAIDLDEFRSGAAVSQIPFDSPVVNFCRAGSRSQEAARILIEAGHLDVRHLDGGVLAWVRDVDPSQPRC